MRVQIWPKRGGGNLKRFREPISVQMAVLLLIALIAITAIAAYGAVYVGPMLRRG